MVPDLLPDCGAVGTHLVPVPLLTGLLSHSGQVSRFMLKVRVNMGSGGGTWPFRGVVCFS